MERTTAEVIARLRESGDEEAALRLEHLHQGYKGWKARAKEASRNLWAEKMARQAAYPVLQAAYQALQAAADDLAGAANDARIRD